MLRPILQRITLTAALLATVFGAGVLVDTTAAVPAQAGTTLVVEAESGGARETPAPHEATAAVQAGPRTPDRRWPFFSFRNGPGKRSW
jgi:hypothetical protein